MPATVVDTPVGPARVHLLGDGPAGLLLLGHGAGGGVDTPDLAAAAAAALALGWRVGLVEQPYRVRGRRVAEAAPRLDAAWRAVCAELAVDGAGPLVTGGRSSGARVACRTATAVGARAVLCLAFPLVPPGRPGVTRAGELAAPTVPRLVVQGDRDPFGMPSEGAGVTVHRVAGADHAFRVRQRDGSRDGPRDVEAVLEGAVGRWLAQVLT